MMIEFLQGMAIYINWHFKESRRCEIYRIIVTIKIQLEHVEGKNLHNAFAKLDLSLRCQLWLFKLAWEFRWPSLDNSFFSLSLSQILKCRLQIPFRIADKFITATWGWQNNIHQQRTVLWHHIRIRTRSR